METEYACSFYIDPEANFLQPLTLSPSMYEWLTFELEA